MKKEFEVLENETIDDCLERMKKEGYRPIRRMEKPLFKEKKIIMKQNISQSHKKSSSKG